MDITRIFFSPKAWPLGNHREVTCCRKNLVCTSPKKIIFCFQKCFSDRCLLSLPLVCLGFLDVFRLSTLTPFVRKWQTQTGSSINLMLAYLPKGTSQQRRLLCDHPDTQLLLRSSCPRKAECNFMGLEKLPQPKVRRRIPQVSF